ncbi:ATP-binding protein [Streptomyces sp. SBT349]|uniref:ATP-binding protein n=1 Tax=Streptomyces sp. SBT349 TaxID=1580539 RepID=UPI000D147D66
MPVMRASLEDREVHHWLLTAEAKDITCWRRVVAQSLRGWQAPVTSVELACLGVSELLANVIRHVADRRCRLEVSRTGGSALVSVFDRSRALPDVATPSWSAERGRGLWLLREMAGAEELGFRFAAEPWGKVVWLRCCLASTSEVAAP